MIEEICTCVALFVKTFAPIDSLSLFNLEFPPLEPSLPISLQFERITGNINSCVLLGIRILPDMDLFLFMNILEGSEGQTDSRTAVCRVDSCVVDEYVDVAHLPPHPPAQLVHRLPYTQFLVFREAAKKFLH